MFLAENASGYQDEPCYLSFKCIARESVPRHLFNLNRFCWWKLACSHAGLAPTTPRYPGGANKVGDFLPFITHLESACLCARLPLWLFGAPRLSTLWTASRR